MNFEGKRKTNKTAKPEVVGSPNKDVVPAFTKAKPSIIRVSTMQQIFDLKNKCKDKMITILFWAIWYPESEEMKKQMMALADGLNHQKICWCDVDKDKEIIEYYEVYKVPHILLLHPHKEDLEYIKAPRAVTIAKVLSAYEEYYQRLFSTEQRKAFNEIEVSLQQFPIVVFMRGDPKEPKCKSSKTLIECLTKMQIKFKSFDILLDDNLKEWLKFFSNWPSFPQIFINQKFIGGTEIILQLVEQDEFLQLIPSECIKANALERIKLAMEQTCVVLFIKGTKEEPMDGYQDRALALLDEHQIRYSTFDVMADSDVREILKEQSRWNSFPQLYVNKKFLGGLAFVEDFVARNKVNSYIPTTEINLPMREKIFKLMEKGCYMVFMRGKPDYPTDQPSMKMMALLKEHYPWVMENKQKPDEALEHFDISKDNNLPLLMLKYAKYSEIPQFYVDGKLVGGLEILEDLHYQGLLTNILLGDGKREHPNNYLARRQKSLGKNKK